MNKSITLDKSKVFAIRIISLYKYLLKEKREFVLSKQILRSGTSIGANITEAECGISRSDFPAKMYIAFKEAVETKYWLDLLFETEYISDNIYKSLTHDCDELIRLLSSITKSVRNTDEGK